MNKPIAHAPQANPNRFHQLGERFKIWMAHAEKKETFFVKTISEGHFAVSQLRTLYPRLTFTVQGTAAGEAQVIIGSRDITAAEQKEIDAAGDVSGVLVHKPVKGLSNSHVDPPLSNEPFRKGYERVCGSRC